LGDQVFREWAGSEGAVTACSFGIGCRPAIMDGEAAAHAAPVIESHSLGPQSTSPGFEFQVSGQITGQLNPKARLT
jgi:hypothetical protein